MKKRVIFIAAALAAMMMTAPASAEEKSMIIGTGQFASTLDPIQGYDGWYMVRTGVCQTLTKMNNDMTISGWLIEDDYTVSEDNTVWTFHIKDGVTFSNGEALTAEKVKKSLMNLFDNGVRGTEYFTPVSIEADGQILTITTEHPEPILVNKLADPIFSIIDADQDLTDVADNGPIGTGPFVFESFDMATKGCTVVKNENYWGGEVKMDKVEFVYTEDQSVLTMGLDSQQFDAVYNISMTDVERYDADPAYNVVRTASGRTTHGFMNQNGPLGDDVLRQAILQSIDRETYCRVLLNGQYVAGKTLITSSAAYGYDELTDPNAYNPENAVAILDEAGYADIDGDGYRETPDGDPLDLEFVFYTGRPEQQVVVEATAQELGKIGIKITPVVNDSATVMDRLAVGDFDLLCMSINVLNCADPENHMNTYFKSGGSYQAYGWKNDDFDGIMDQLSETADPAARIDLVKEAEQILLDETVCIYFCYPLMNFVLCDGVSGIESTPADYYWISEVTDVQ